VLTLTLTLNSPSDWQETAVFTFACTVNVARPVWVRCQQHRAKVMQTKEAGRTLEKENFRFKSNRRESLIFEKSIVMFQQNFRKLGGKTCKCSLL